MNKIKNIFKKSVAAVMAVAIFATTAIAAPVNAQVAVSTTKYQEARVSFTFDDGFLSTRTIAAPVLESRGIDGVIYATSGYIDTGLAEDGTLPAMNWTQLQELQNTYGWEVGGHTQTHPEMPTITAAQIKTELENSNLAFKQHGLLVSNFASPFGAYDNKVLTEVLKHYDSHRGFADIQYNTFPEGKAILQVQQVNSVTTVAQVKGYIDQAIANKTWLILVFHDVAAAKNPNYEYTTTTSELTQIADYVKSKNVKTTTVRDELNRGNNLVTNSTMDDAFTNGWTTDNTTQVTQDNANNGAFGTANTSVKMTGGTTASHIFSSAIANIPGANYLIESFYNTINLTAGEFGYYLDEYDANGTWISGQWLGNVVNNAIGYFTKVVTATSAQVATFKLQEYLTANAQGSVYVDNTSMYNLDATQSATPVPSASPTATPSGTPTYANMIKNPEFVDGMSNWTTDNATAVLLEGQTVKMTGTTTAAHLFQSGIEATKSANYILKADVNANALTAGELGFYVDEYDANGTWISGHWLGKIVNGVTSTFQAAFVATSDLVKSLRVQTYLTAGSTGNAIVDNYSLTDTNAPIATATPAPSADPSATPSATPTASASATPTPSASPAGNNLVSNWSFEELLSGFANLWTRDNNNFTINTASKGNDGTNSLSIMPNVDYSHAFSANITIDPTKTYTWKQHLTATGTTGEFGFYIDEYDAAGTWISGQWKGAISTAYTGDQQFAYTPTSATVNKVRLQYYVIPNSNFEVYLDSVSLTAN